MAVALRRAGHELGGSFGRGELARWLAARFGAALATRQAQLRSLEAGGAEEAGSVTRRVELRSLVREAMPVMEDAQPGRTHATVELGRPALLIQEHAHPAVDQIQAVLATSAPAGGGSRSQQRRSGRAALVVLAIAVAAGASFGVAALHRSGDERPHGPATAEPASAAATIAAPAGSPPPVPAARPAEAPSVVVSPAPAPAIQRDPAMAPAATPAHRPPARLSIDSEPFAVIELDGKPLGTTPLYQVRIAAGRHVLRAETGDGRVQRRAIDVAPGTVTGVVLRWGPGASRDPG
jgi:hypothetical protein